MDLALLAAISLAGISGAALAVFSFFGYWKHKKSVAIWALCATIVFTLMAVLTWQNGTWQRADSGPYSILTSDQIVDPRNMNTLIWVTTRHIAFPVHRTVVIQLTNNQTIPSIIETYTLEARNKNGNWVKLIHMDIRLGDVYWVPNGTAFKKARLINMRQLGLDYALDRRLIKPRETVFGWAFFETPEDFGEEALLRVYVKDFGGAEVTKDVVSAPLKDFGELKGTLDMREEWDISSYTRKYFSELTAP